MAKRTINGRAQQALDYARQLKQEMKNWLEAYNALYGTGGKCARLFPTQAERIAFANTPEYQHLTDLLNLLPDPPVQSAASPLAQVSGNLHVRLPRSLHAALRAEAEVENISLNQLIVAKLSMQLRALAQAEPVI